MRRVNTNCTNYSLVTSRHKENSLNKKHVMVDPLAVIYNEGAWRVNKVSPLYNLQYDPIKLKQYSSKIIQSITSTVSTASSVKYCVQCTAQPYLKYSQEDADGLMITVTSCAEKNNNKKLAYMAVLLSWGSRSNLENATHLLSMLERGEQRLSTAVKAALQKTFDCTIKGFHFTQAQLAYLGFTFLGNGSPRCNDSFTLCYTDPQSDLKEKITLSCNAGDMQYIWNRVTDEVPNSTEQVKLAYHILENQIFHMIGMNIKKFELCEVKLPQAEAKINGMVKMKTPELVNCVLTILNEISSHLLVSSSNNSDASICSSSSSQ